MGIEISVNMFLMHYSLTVTILYGSTYCFINICTYETINFSIIGILLVSLNMLFILIFLGNLRCKYILDKHSFFRIFIS